MAYLYNATASVAGESNKLSLSVWLRIPSIGLDTTKLIGFCEWGHNTDASRVRANRFYIQYLSVGSGQGNNLWYPGGFCWGVERERSPGDPDDSILLEDSFSFGTNPHAVSSVGGMQTDAWNHFAMAFDLGSDLNHFNPNGSFTTPLVLNGNQINVGGGNASVTQDSVTGAVRPIVITDQGLRMQDNDVTVPWLDGSTGVGGQLWNNKIDMADFQLWYGDYIDWRISGNFAKVVQIVNGRGYPVNPSVATAAFGTQQILFKGKASDSSFYFNRGNGGSFSKIGTISDFTPAPSYG